MFATFLATTMVVVFAIANVIRQKRSGKMFTPTAKNTFVCCVFVLIAGATFSNGLFHFIHGILGFSDFPAPFAKFVNNGLFTNISNVIWGSFNLFVAIFVTLSYKKSLPKWTFAFCFSVGFLSIAFMLRYMLLSNYFETHVF